MSPDPTARKPQHSAEQLWETLGKRKPKKKGFLGAVLY
jgi:hypothetical protein